MDEMNFFEASSSHSSLPDQIRVVQVPTDASIGTLSEVKIPESCGSFSCRVEQHQIPAIRNRFLTWRASGSDLILEEHSMDWNLNENSVRLHFNNSIILPGTAIYGSTELLFILVPTLCSVHRITVPHPREMHRHIDTRNSTNSLDSILSQLTDDSISLHYRSLLNYSTAHTAACVLNSNMEAVFTLSLADGSVLIVTMPTYGSKVTVSTQELVAPSSMVSRFLSPFSSPDCGAAEMICNVDPQNAYHLYLVTRDGKLKIMDIANKTYKCSIDLANFVAVGGKKSAVRVEDNIALRKCTLREMLFLVVYFTLDDRAYFVILCPTEQRTNAAKVMAVEAPENLQLVDFSLSTGFLWTLWKDNGGRSYVKINGINVTNVSPSRWESVCLTEDFPTIEHLFSQKPPDQEMDEYMLNNITKDGRFSFSTVMKAVKVYSNNWQNIREGDWRELNGRLVALLDAKIGHKPNLNESILSITDESILGVVGKRHAKIWKDVWRACIQYHEVSSNVLGLLCCPQMELYGIIRAEQFSTFVPIDSKLKQLVLPQESISLLSENLEPLNKKELKMAPKLLFETLNQKFQSDFGANLNPADLCSFCEAALDLMDPDIGELITNEDEVEEEYGNFGRSVVACGFVRSALERSVRDRALLCTRLCVMLARTESQRGLSTGIRNRLESLCTKIIFLSRNYDLMTDLCDAQIEGETGASLLWSLITCPLISSLIGRLLSDRVDSSCVDWSFVWGVGCEPMVAVLLTLLWPSSNLLVLPQFLLDTRRYKLLMDYCSQLTPWPEQTAGALAYYYAVALANNDMAHEAFEYFCLALEALKETDMVLLDKISSTFKDSQPPFEGQYFLKVISVYEQVNEKDYVIKTARLGLQKCLQTDTYVPTLWTIVFKCELSRQNYPSALLAVRSNPDEQSGRNCLRQFLLALVDDGQTELLCSMHYANLEQEVINILESRARAADLNKEPDYYELLYAFHVHRDNFRKASIVMYELSLRLNHEQSGPSSLRRRCRSLATCLQTLQLVNPDYAWIVRPAARSNDTAARKRANDGGTVVPSGLSLEIVTHSALLNEFLLADARCCLATTQRSAVMPSQRVEEVIQALLQYQQFDKALTLCEAFGVEIDGVVEKLTLRCVTSDGSCKWIQQNKMLVSENLAPIDSHSQCWRLLQLYLEHLSYKKHNMTSLYRCVTQTVLSHKKTMPVWLSEVYKAADIGDLLRVLCEYDCLCEAAKLAVNYIDAVMGKGGQDEFDLKNTLAPGIHSVWLPYTSLNWLLELMQNDGGPDAFEMKNELEYKLDKYFHQLNIVSESMTLSR